MILAFLPPDGRTLPEGGSRKHAFPLSAFRQTPGIARTEESHSGRFRRKTGGKWVACGLIRHPCRHGSGERERRPSDKSRNAPRAGTHQVLCAGGVRDCRLTKGRLQENFRHEGTLLENV